MQIDPSEIFILILNRGGFIPKDDLISEFDSIFRLKGDFHNSGQGYLANTIDELVLDGVLCEFNPEDWIYRKENFQNNIDEYEISKLKENLFYSLGPNSLPFLKKTKEQLLDHAQQQKMYDAKRVLEKFDDEENSTTFDDQQRISISERNLDKLVLLLQKAISDIDALKIPNAQSYQAKAYLECALILATCPDPEPNMIWELIQKAGNISQVAALLVAIIALFVVG